MLKPKNIRSAHCQGFTLLEMMISMGVFVTIVTLMGTLLHAIYTSIDTSNKQVLLSSQARNSVGVLRKDMKSANAQVSQLVTGGIQILADVDAAVSISQTDSREYISHYLYSATLAATDPFSVGLYGNASATDYLWLRYVSENVGVAYGDGTVLAREVVAPTASQFEAISSPNLYQVRLHLSGDNETAEFTTLLRPGL